MESITVETVCSAAQELLDGDRSRPRIFTQPEFEEIADSFLVDPNYGDPLAGVGLTSIDAVFAFDAARNLTKSNLAGYRSRLQFEIDSPQSARPTTVFLKRYDRPPIPVQFGNLLRHRSRKSCASCEFEPICELSAAGIRTPRVIAYGAQWAGLLENRSFIVTEKIPDADAIERRLPDCFDAAATAANLRARKDFIAGLARFVRRFHATGYRHRDLYFAHIFHDARGDFHLIDLARAFRPVLLKERFRLKDIAQLHYSAPGARFSGSDRLRFYLAYTGRKTLGRRDKAFIRRVVAKANRMARHDYNTRNEL